MKKLALFCALCTPLIAHSAWTDINGKPIADTDSKRSVGNFGAEIVLTADGKVTKQVWSTSSGANTLKPINSVRRGSPLSAVIVMTGCAADASGHCDVIASFTLQSPNGQKKSGGTGHVWSDAPVANSSMLGQASLTAKFDQTDPVGNYRILADVTDKVSGKTLSLSAPFTLSP